MGKSEKKSKKNLSMDENLDQIIDMKKSENRALKKIYESLKKDNLKENTHEK